MQPIPNRYSIDNWLKFNNLYHKNTFISLHSSPYNYIPHGHIITGNLDFIENVDLKEVLSYGCKYRIPLSCTPETIFESVAEAVNKFISSKSKKYCQKEEWFKDWKDRVLNIVSNRIEYFKKNHPEKFTTEDNILEKEDVKRYLKLLKVVVVDTQWDDVYNRWYLRNKLHL